MKPSRLPYVTALQPHEGAWNNWKYIVGNLAIWLAAYQTGRAIRLADPGEYREMQLAERGTLKGSGVGQAEPHKVQLGLTINNDIWVSHYKR